MMDEKAKKALKRRIAAAEKIGTSWRRVLFPSVLDAEVERYILAQLSPSAKQMSQVEPSDEFARMKSMSIVPTL